MEWAEICFPGGILREQDLLELLNWEGEQHWDEAGPSGLCCSHYTWNSKKVLAVTHWGLEADERQTKTVRDLDQRGLGNWVIFLHTAAIAGEHRI